MRIDWSEPRARLLRWYDEVARDLPWRRTRDPYAIWVSEIMLQQTRVETVIRYYERFLGRFPTALALAEAPADEVLSMWSGLGYYRRARLLLEGARAVAEQGGAVPGDRAGLLGVPGIGKYTAGAIASIAFGEPVGLVDGNVARVLARLFAIDEDMRKAGMRIAEQLADVLVARQDPGAWNQALMELGATVCTPRAPACVICPLAAHCRARAEGRVAELPVLSAKTPPRAQRVQSLVAVSADGAVLLARRAHGGLFGGLWEPPSLDGPASVRAALAAWLPVSNPVRRGAIEHVLSHRHLTVDVLRATMLGPATGIVPPAPYEAVRLVHMEAFEALGMSTLTRKILAAAGVL
ncbi:MAG: A/G-specific adenine glycosylase [Labilithrix sp.]|nr:A/G-specific adenine glycosylase [Labilithrix sp.]